MNNLTIIITSFNRPLCLLRNLKYLTSFKENYKIIIADSSEDDKKFYDIKQIILKNNFIFKSFPSKIKVAQKISEALNLVSTKYSVLCADDDFIYPPSVKKCINFLKNNPDYTTCHGKYYIHTSYNDSKKYGVIFRNQSMNINSCEFEDPLERVQFYIDGKLGSQYPFYAVSETVNLKKIWHQTNMYANDWLINEYFPCIISLIIGKMKSLPIFYMSREPNLNNWVNKDRINLIFKKEMNDIYSKGIVENLKMEGSAKNFDGLEDKFMNIFELKKQNLLINKTNISSNNKKNLLKSFLKVYYYIYKKKVFEFQNKSDLQNIKKIEDLIIKTGDINSEITLSRKKY